MSIDINTDVPSFSFENQTHSKDSLIDDYDSKSISGKPQKIQNSFSLQTDSAVNGNMDGKDSCEIVPNCEIYQTRIEQDYHNDDELEIIDDDMFFLEPEISQELSVILHEKVKGNPENLELVQALIERLSLALEHEESKLLLMQKIWLNQNSSANTCQTISNGHRTDLHSSNAINNSNNINHGKAHKNQSILPNVTDSVVSFGSILDSANNINQIIPPAPKVSTQTALQNFEQHIMNKRNEIRRCNEEGMNAVLLPNPNSSDIGWCWGENMNFIPSGVTLDFLPLVGLEEVVNTIQQYDVLSRGENLEILSKSVPNECSECGTDFTPQWKSKISVLETAAKLEVESQRGQNNTVDLSEIDELVPQGHRKIFLNGKSEIVKESSVLCESCVSVVLRQCLKQNYTSRIRTVSIEGIKREKELESEYKRVRNDPAELEKLRVEQEKKLQANHIQQNSLPNRTIQTNAPSSVGVQRSSISNSSNSAVFGLNQQALVAKGGQSVINSNSSKNNNNNQSSSRHSQHCYQPQVSTTMQNQSNMNVVAPISNSQSAANSISATDIAMLQSLYLQQHTLAAAAANQTSNQNIELQRLLGLGLLNTPQSASVASTNQNNDLQLMLLQSLLNQNPLTATFILAAIQQQQQQQQQVSNPQLNITNNPFLLSLFQQNTAAQSQSRGQK